MHRFFIYSKNIAKDKVILEDKEQIHHLRDVLRLQLRDEVVVCDENGNEYNCYIEELLKNKVILNIKSKAVVTKNATKAKITVACAIPKKSKMDDIIDRLTQLGVDRIIPLVSERVIIKLDKNKQASRLGRWRKIALNSSQQSQRNTLPIIAPAKGLKGVLAECGDYDLKLILTLIEEREPLKDVLSNSRFKNILLFIGPEGDFTAEEVDLAKKFGSIPVSLGDLVLRVETAAIAVVSILNYVLK